MKPIALTILGLICISVSAHLPLQLPLIPTDIPGTWQTFAVLVFSYFCTRWVAVAACAAYLLIGVLGAPVFADGSSGFEVLTGRTGGYLYGFLLAAWVSASFAKHEAMYCHRPLPRQSCLSNWIKYFAYCFLAMSAGTALILACGVIHLSLSIGVSNALQYGLYPFLLGAFVKILIGALAIVTINVAFNRLTDDSALDSA